MAACWLLAGLLHIGGMRGTLLLLLLLLMMLSLALPQLQ
jgi:hypothetical protein